MDIYIGMRIFDDKALVLNEMDTTLQNCIDTCLKNEECNSFSFDKSGEDRTNNCANYRWYQKGDWPIRNIIANQLFYDEAAYTSGILCSFEARSATNDYTQPENYILTNRYHTRQTRPNRQPDNKYTLPGK